ncbi:DUF429 domain-containing protein [Methylopila henanensis]|uniref:DUF429 domain-containing protein n=1 Tax=Methylopila henanensis TaxID=873516 RepID=A0ABW4K744_9HYPH
MVAATTSIIGFDSAWVDKPTAPGAVCAIRLTDGGRLKFIEPLLASFAQALEFIREEQRHSERCLVALDQPTIVPNASSCRPVDRVAGSLISWLGGGVQPANRSKIGMFDDAAPIWRFKEALGAIEDPEGARSAAYGLFLIEAFPAMALPTLEAAYFGYKLGPRYNPDRRKTFKLEHWRGVLAAVSRFALVEGLAGIANWAEKATAIEKPRKADQDKLDAVICALVGYQWLVKSRAGSVMIGDLKTGYMIVPVSPDVRTRLRLAAVVRGVTIDGFI